MKTQVLVYIITYIYIYKYTFFGISIWENVEDREGGVLDFEIARVFLYTRLGAKARYNQVVSYLKIESYL